MTRADGTPHADVVAAWLGGVDNDPDVLIEAFGSAFGALWVRTSTTLGEVTLTAIADRVLHTAGEMHAILVALELEGNGVLDLAELRVRAANASPDALRDAVRFVLVHFLTVLGNLTADILTPDLHAELASTLSLPAEPPRVPPQPPVQTASSGTQQ